MTTSVRWKRAGNSAWWTKTSTKGEADQPNMSSAEFKWVIHDPYGQFDPSLMSESHGRRRYDWGMSLVSGDEIGRGRNAAVEPSSISRRRVGDKSAGMHYLLFPTR